MGAAGIIVGTDGLPVLLKGITWPGFDSGTMLNNLQARLTFPAPTQIQTALHLKLLPHSVNPSSCNTRPSSTYGPKLSLHHKIPVHPRNRAYMYLTYIQGQGSVNGKQ